MTNIIIVRDAHIVVEEVTQLINVIDYGFPPNYKRRKFLVNNVTAIKKANESEALTNQKESQQSSSFSLTKEQYNSFLTLLQQSQSQLTATPSTEHHHISNTSTGIICNLKSLPKSVIWILDSGATDHISLSLENFARYGIIPYSYQAI